MKIGSQLVKLIKKFQKTKVTAQYIYTHLARRVKNRNQKMLLKIAEEEGRHARLWAKYTGKRCKPNQIKAFLYLFIAWLFGFTLL